MVITATFSAHIYVSFISDELIMGDHGRSAQVQKLKLINVENLQYHESSI
jgi:hypothetical protein